MGETWSLEIQTNRHLNMEWLYIYIYKTMWKTWSLWTFEHGMITRRWGNTWSLWTFEHGMTTRRCGRHDLCGHSNMEWLQDNGGIHDLCGHSNMEWLQDDVEDMISGYTDTWTFEHGMTTRQCWMSEWVSDCCLTPIQQLFSYIMARTS